MKTHALKILAVSLGLCAAAGNLAAQVTLTNLFSFTVQTPGVTNGCLPAAGLVQGKDGYFYGTTQEGGVPNNSGTVFRISPSGSLTILWTFDLNFIPTIYDGGKPEAGLVQGTDGYFYGTTSSSGTNAAGTVFKLDTNGSLTVLHTFLNNGSDGQVPTAGLVQGSDGYFYGTTSIGGTYNGGAIYRINPTGSSYTTLYSFTNHPAQAKPEAALVQGSDGNFYGTTAFGGTNGEGTVFQFNTNGSLTVLHTFASGGTDGYLPDAGLMQGSDGNFYGTTYYGGTNAVLDSGTVFRISPGGSYTILHSFGSVTGEGRNPDAGLVQGSDGNFYGTTSQGGTNDHGNVFKLIVPLNPPANQISAIQVAGTNVLVTLPSVAAEFYQLQSRASLTTGAWADVAGASAKSIGGSLTVTNFGGFPQSQQFYRFAITP
jgi:uncharacterized repeat protein (TIGR03803 family)